MTQLKPIVLNHAGVELIGQMASPEGSGLHPAVMVIHTAHGLCSLMRSRVRQLSELGYVAVAADMYGGSECDTARTLDGTLMMELRNAPDRLRARVVAWHQKLASLPGVDAARLAVIGFCFGGLCALELARSGADVKAVVSFHGLLATSNRAAVDAIRGQVAIFTGARDPYAPVEHVETLRKELTRAMAKFQITTFSDASHAFTDPKADAMGRAGIAYDALADRVSWAATVALLHATLCDP